MRILTVLAVFTLMLCNSQTKKSQKCKASLMYEFVGLVPKDSISEVLPVELKVSVMDYDGVLKISDCKGNAEIKVFSDKDGSVIIKGQFLGGEQLEKIEVFTVTSNQMVADSIEVYKTFMNGNWIFNKLKYKTDDDLIE
ncbi:hypothetical protein [Flagellimonas sp. CMM7]|uniref:hypothetical protein n=1 Tax=Flagellimonas sp. CMM7 TaxID=2654676 RepID=UPI00196A01FA|nr:hypothetical protein [Flagellimonas sp. CMM7]UII80117.1 hypothetical protein LV704_01020 [Flagellimonas sp. CMM7]